MSYGRCQNLSQINLGNWKIEEQKRERAPRPGRAGKGGREGEQDGQDIQTGSTKLTDEERMMCPAGDAADVTVLEVCQFVVDP